MESLAKGLSFSGIGKLLAKAFPSSAIITTITTTMAETGASLPSVLLGLIGVPFKTFFTVTLPGVIGSAISGLGASIASGVAGLASALGISVAAAAAIVVAAVVAAIAAIVYTATHWDEIKEFWTQTVPDWWSGTVMPFFESIPEKLSSVWELVKTTASSKWDGFIEYLTGLPEKVGNVIENIADWFNGLPEKLGYALGFALGTVTKWGVDLFAYLSTKIPEIISAVVKWFSEMPGKIYTGISTFINNVATWGIETYNAFNQKVSEIIAGTVKWFSEMPEKIYDTIIKIKEKISTWATNAISFFRTEVPVIVDKVIEFFGDLPKKIVTVGENIIKGLWEGITNLSSWIGDKISEFCDGILEGFHKGFDEHSPSKKAFQIGDYFTIGLMNGIEDKFGAIYSKVDDFTGNLTATQISLPFIDSSVQVNREIFDMVDTKASVSYDTPSYDFKAGISAELNAALSGIIDYEKMANTMAPIVARALENADIKAKIGDQEVWSSTKDSWAKEYSRNKKAPVPI
jgi:phage-related protein